LLEVAREASGERRQEEEEEAKRLQLEEAQRAEEAKRRAEEAQRAQEERQAEEARTAELERRLCEEEEQTAAQAAQEQLEQLEQWEREAAAARAQEEQAKAELAAAQEMVAEFLRAAGLKSVTEVHRRCCKTSTALHRAVEEKDPEVVKALLRCGASPDTKNSGGKTPRELAEKFNRKGSHDAVLAALS